MKRRLLIGIALPVLVLVAAAAFIAGRTAPAPAAQGAPAHVDEARVEIVGGETQVILPAKMQGASALLVSRLAAAPIRSSQAVWASVLDLQPLFDLGGRLALARAERDAARAQAGLSQQQAGRAQILFEDDRNVSRKSLDEARAAARADHGKLAALDASLNALEASMRRQFGDALAGAATAPSSDTWRRLVAGQASVVRVTFPASSTAPERLAIETPGGELAARKLSVASQLDPMLQGVAWLYLVQAPLPSGLRTAAHGAAGDKSATGVLVPDEAIVWHGDTRWVYVRTAADRFARRPVHPAAPAPHGVIASEGLRAGDEVVTRGAALLLSEEQRPRGIATQCADPPECDD